MLVTYTLSGFFWILGYIYFLPVTLVILAILGWDLTYITWLMLFQDPAPLTWDQWVNYPLRKVGVQSSLAMLGSLTLLLPFASAIIMPILGYLAVWDIMDYVDQGKVHENLMMPF